MMHKCEIFSIRKNKDDFDSLQRNLDEITEKLGAHGIDVRWKTDVSPNPAKLRTAVSESLSGESADIFIFANALTSTDSESFRSLFYELVSDFESELVPSPDHIGETPKIKISSLGDMGGGYRGYCFKFRGKIFITVPCASLTGLDIPDLIESAVKKADRVLTENSSAYPDGISYAESSANGKKKEGFFRSFIPHKGDSRKTVINKTIVLAAILAFIGAGAYVLNFFIFEPMQNNSINSEIQSIAYRQNSDDTNSDGDEGPEQDWAALKKINKEIVGWIRMDGTPIDYPVLYRKSDDQNYQFYLKHTYKGEYSDYGSIFVDYRCKQGTDSRNLILHGHNMLNGSMFRELLNYSDRFTPNLKYYKKHPVITFNTPDGDATWKIISVFKTSTMYEHGEFFNYMQGEFNSDAEFMNFVYNMRIRSMFNIPVMVNEDDQILTLSTCSYEFTNFRTVVVARKVRPGEDESVDVQLATVNSDPLYPDVYYRSYGGTRPDPLTFKTANAKGLVSWYDGKGNLEGAEDLTATLAANPTEPPTDKKGNRVDDQQSYTYYEVVYRNFGGTQLAAYNVREGDPLPIPDIVPTYEDEYYNYYFVEWDLDIPGLDINSVDSSLIIYPKYNPVLKEQ